MRNYFPKRTSGAPCDTLSKQVEKVHVQRGKKSSKDMASSRNLVSIIGAVASPKMGGRNKVSGRVSVPCWYATPVAIASWKPLKIRWKSKSDDVPVGFIAPLLRQCYALYAVAEGWLFLDIGWFVLFFRWSISWDDTHVIPICKIQYNVFKFSQFSIWFFWHFY